MSANVILGVLSSAATLASQRLVLAVILLGAITGALRGYGSDEEGAEQAVASLLAPLEKQGFDFRADVWERELKPDVGKAVRMQMFKGNDYRVCIAVSANSGVQIEAHVLDESGKQVENKIDGKGHSLTLQVKPKSTGVYIVTIRQLGGKKIAATCALILGYR